MEKGYCNCRFLSTTANLVLIHLNDLMTDGQQNWPTVKSLLPLALFLFVCLAIFHFSYLISSCFYAMMGRGAGTANWKYG